MKKCCLAILAASLFGAAGAMAQLGDLGALGDAAGGGGAPGGGGGIGNIPVEISSDSTRVENGVAVADGNVQIHYKEYSIYCDHAEYSPETRDVVLIGNIRLYSADGVLTGQQGVFNFNTRQLRALEFSGSKYPMLFKAFNLRAPSMREIYIRDAMLTTDDSSQPDFHVRAKTVRIYTDSRVIFLNTSVYVGNIPIFWFPYLFANINNTGFEFLPGYDSRWGGYLQTAYTFPIGTGGAILGKVHLDYRSELGIAAGFDAIMKYGKDDRSYGKFISYYAWDKQPDRQTGGPGEPPEKGQDGRYRVTFKQRLFLTDDIYATADINLLSDEDFLEDFYPNEFRTDPQPDNVVSVTKWDEFYTLNLIARFQVNDFQQTVERLPELVFDFKQHRLFGMPFYYDGETSVGDYRMAFSDTPELGGQYNYPNYESVRFDTFHQITFPNQLFGWLNLTPRAGFRMTYYNKSGTFQDFDGSTTEIDPVTGEEQIITGPSIESTPLNTPTPTLNGGGSIFRPVANLGVEVSTKFSKAYERIQSRWLGLDGVRHIVQPYMNYSYVYNFGPSPNEILQFDSVVPSTELLPLDFPQFTGIDSIDTWSIMRVGVRNRLQTRRDQRTFQWFQLDSFLDLNYNNPYSDGSVSNVFNNFVFRPVPWMSFNVESQFPMVSEGFTETNSNITVMPTRDTMFRFGHRYIVNNEYFGDNSQVDFYAYVRLNDNWGVSLYEQYEYFSNILQYQRYMIHRDLSSWVASIGAQVRDNKGGDTDLGLLLVLSLKDAPQVTLPIQFDTATSPMEPGASGN